MLARRTRAEVAALREAVLDAWAAGWSMAAIAARSGTTVSNVGCILHEARRRGEARAGFRYHVAGTVRVSAPPPPPPPAPAPLAGARAALLHAAKGIVPGPDGRRARKDAILDAWAAGLESPEIGAALGMRWRTATMVVSRAREKGDPRAHRCQHDPADGLSTHMRVTLDRLGRRYGVTASIPGETACSQAS